MKFVANTLSKCVPRLGKIRDVESHPNFVFETPFPMLYTKGGNIPNITHEILKLVTCDPQVIQIPIASTHHFMEAMAEYPGNISEFVGLRDCMTCVTVQDPGDLTLPGHHQKDHMPIWTRAGKVLLSANVYMDAIEAFKPDMYYLLSDGDTNLASSTKRISKSVENTLGFLEKCLDRHKKSEALKNTFVMACVAGGYSEKARETCINSLIKHKEDLGGFLIDGLHNNGPEVEFIKFDELKNIIECIVSKLPEDKMRVIHGCWNPVTILHMVQLGVDVFDTSYCHVVTERSSALTFSFDLEETEENTKYEINLRQTRYLDDFQPILQGCTCLTCMKHSRGYVHHLVTIQELLGPLLLTIHNMHHYLRFFEKIRECIRNDTLPDLINLVKKQFNDYQRENMDPNTNINREVSADLS